MSKSQSDIVREWFARKPLPTCTADCRQCESETGIPAKNIFIVMRHARTPEQRRTYFRDRKREYLRDPEKRARHYESIRKYKARLRSENAHP